VISKWYFTVDTTPVQRKLKALAPDNHRYKSQKPRQSTESGHRDTEQVQVFPFQVEVTQKSSTETNGKVGGEISGMLDLKSEIYPLPTC